jgi:hypothetical protein
VQAQILQIIDAEVDQRLERKLNALLPGLLAGYADWDKGGQRGPAPIPLMVSSESDNMLVTPPATTAVPQPSVPPPAITVAPQLNAPGRKNTPASINSNTCGASTLAELNAIKVTCRALDAQPMTSSLICISL